MKKTEKEIDKNKILKSIEEKVSSLLPDLKIALIFYADKGEVFVGGVPIT